LEPQVDSQTFDRIQPVIAAFAAAGRREWRDGRVDVQPLVDLVAVREQLDALDGTARASPDARANAIEAAIEAAINTLPDPFRTAALDHFAFTDDKPTPRTKGERERLAAKSFSKGDRWYRKPTSRYYDLSPQDYVIALVAAALCGVADPVAFTAGRESDANNGAAIEAELPAPIARRHATRYRWLAALGGVLAVSVTVVVIAQPGGGHSSRWQGGTSTVSISDPRRIERLLGPPTSIVEPAESGRIDLEECTAARCRKTPTQEPPPRKPTDPRLPKIFHFTLEILGSYRDEIKSMNLKASSTVEEGSNSVTAVARWSSPISSQIETHASTASVATPTQTASGLPHLEYVAGSTELYERRAGGSSGEVPIFKLPDGLFSPAGLTLTHVGFARQCRPSTRDCPLVVVAIIHFDTRLAP
jgi:hypothetical protein